MRVNWRRLGRFLKKVRGEKTQTALAKETGLSQITISGLENGNRSIGLERLVSISAAYNLPIEKILECVLDDRKAVS
jgi:transcriptional regulator with XRE-family HTH domain